MDDRSAPGTDPRRRSRVMYGSDSLNGGAAEKSTAMWQDSQHDTGDVREEAMLSASATAGERRDASPGRSPVSPGASLCLPHLKRGLALSQALRAGQTWRCE
mmetsp:Transcript_27650/g.84285  ORF Transcript_27650/g.84285 Transcript_27650/m.84285 type:complete len:102 (-) Transcript_27650:926-1231(-)